MSEFLGVIAGLGGWLIGSLFDPVTWVAILAIVGFTSGLRSYIAALGITWIALIFAKTVIEMVYRINGRVDHQATIDLMVLFVVSGAIVLIRNWKETTGTAAAD